MKKQEYRISVNFDYPGRYFILAKSADEALKLVNSNCWKYPSRAHMTHPVEHVIENKSRLIGWDFSMTNGWKTTIGNVKPAPRLPHAISKQLRKNNRKKCYEVEVTYSRWGIFYAKATTEVEARELVEKYGKQRNPVYRTSLPFYLMTR